MKKIFALLLALVMVFALVACGEPETPDTPETPNTPVETPETPSTPETPETPAEPEVTLDTENPIIIGHLADLTGNEASTGVLGQKAVDFAAKLINEQGGIAGRQVIIETLDCQSSASAAAAGVRTLVEEKGAVAIVGPT